MRAGGDLAKAIEAELAAWPGVRARRERGGKHFRLVLGVAGRERFLVYPGTPSDRRAGLNAVAQMRRILAALGARRLPRI